jgi:Zn-dependent M28 family amino/carboxypeptidase
MPGESYTGPVKPSEEDKKLAKELKKYVSHLADNIGERNYRNYQNLCTTANYIEDSFKSFGYQVKRQSYTSEESGKEQTFYNLEAELKGTEKPDEIIVFGAHYDSANVDGCRAANDNGSGIAATLAAAKYFAGKNQKRTIRFVAFANEEPPFFWGSEMGSYVYAMECEEKKENIVAMLTPETIGYYSNEKGSQKYPYPLNTFYPSEGNFIAFVGNYRSKELVKECVKIFRENAKFPSEGAALPEITPMIGASDHWSFWQAGYPALMVTDTAPFRYPYYHTNDDNTDKIDFEKMAIVVSGLEKILEKLANQ